MATNGNVSPPLEKETQNFEETTPYTLESEKVDDVAADLIDASVHIDEALDRKLFWRVNRRVLPFMMLAYFLQALDKNTTSLASIMGLQADTNMVGQDYALTSTCLWIGIILGEIPANRIAQRFPTAKVLGIGCIAWGVCLIGPAFMHSAAPFLVFRVILGLCESVVGPCLFTIMVMWYKKDEQPLITAIWQGTYGFSVVVSGAIGYGFTTVHTSFHGWRILFLFIAGFSIIAGIVVTVFLPDSPQSARWATREEKTLFVERVRANDQGIKHPKLKPHQIKEALTDIYCWSLFGMGFVNAAVCGGINTFSQLLINKAFGFSAAQAQLLNMPLGAMSTTAYLIAAYLVRRTGETTLVMCGLIIPNLIATILLIVITPTPSTKAGLVVVFYFTQFFQAANFLNFTLMSRNIAGSSKKIFGYAMVFLGWAGGNATAPQIFQARWAPRYKNSLFIHIGLYGLFVVVALFSRQIVIRRNRAKQAAREVAEGTHVNKHVHAFEGLTDGENPDFVYSR